MYAIVFDLDMESLQELYHNDSYKNAYANIRNFLEKRGFDHMQGSTYFGDDTIDAVSCVLTVQDLTAEFDWFAGSVRDIRMLKIEENNDLGPVIDRAIA